MRLTSVHIENFRGLKDIEFELPSTVTAIVGPNAIGKSSILEAIRLTKAILAPSFFGEGQQVVSSLGALIPSLNTLRLDALFGDVAAPLEVTLKIELTPAEVQLVGARVSQLAQLRVRNLLGSANTDELALVQYLSTSEGQERYNTALRDVTDNLQQIETSPYIVLSLTIDPSVGGVRGGSAFHQEIATTLMESQPPSLGVFTYFPADRAMPSGEVNIQLGSADATAQLHSHLAQPASKYQRLKQHLVNQTLTDAAETMKQDFAVVFDRLLTGKKLENLTLTPEGLLSVSIRELETGAVYDIDGMSSGEKGLLLTFFLMKRSTAPGGIILLDEPELHLNPTVSKKIIPFLLEEVLEPLGVQAIVCTHSPEILAHAYDDSNCTLLHLRSGRVVSPIYPEDKGEVIEALSRLGSQLSDVLFSRGSMYVEGEHDADLLATGWPDRVAGYKLTKLGGRDAVEKEIKKLQDPEQETKLDNAQCFFFDLDRKPTDLASTSLVKVQQWDRYCLENYLLDRDAIHDVCQAGNFTSAPSRGEVVNMLRDAALGQLRGVVAREIYQAREPENPGFRPKLAYTGSYEEIGGKLLARLESIKEQLAKIDSSNWLQSYKAECEARESELREQWQENWRVCADGKHALNEVFKQVGATCGPLEFKRRIVSEMRIKKTESWRVVDNILESTLVK